MKATENPVDLHIFVSQYYTDMYICIHMCANLYMSTLKNFISGFKISLQLITDGFRKH